MVELIFRPRRSRQFQSILQNDKLIFLCLVLTIAVLYGNLGAGKFGTPKHDFNEIRETFYNICGKHVETRHVLEEASQSQSSNDNAKSINNYATFDIKKIFVDEEPDELKDLNQPLPIDLKGNFRHI